MAVLPGRYPTKKMWCSFENLSRHGFGDPRRGFRVGLPDKIRQRPAYCSAGAQHLLRIAADMAHDQACALHHQHDAVRLNRSRDMDRFTVALGKAGRLLVQWVLSLHKHDLAKAKAFRAPVTASLCCSPDCNSRSRMARKDRQRGPVLSP